MKQPSKFKRWFLGLFGGVPKSDYNIVIEQRDNFIGDVNYPPHKRGADLISTS